MTSGLQKLILAQIVLIEIDQSAAWNLGHYNAYGSTTAS